MGWFQIRRGYKVTRALGNVKAVRIGTWILTYLPVEEAHKVNANEEVYALAA